MTKDDLQKVRDALALEMPFDNELDKPLEGAIATLDAELAKPEPQPVAWMGYSGVGEKIVSPKAIYSWMTIPLYTAPVAAPQREWVELKDDEVTEIADRCIDIFGLADLISEALRAKNEGKNHG